MGGKRHFMYLYNFRFSLCPSVAVCSHGSIDRVYLWHRQSAAMDATTRWTSLRFTFFISALTEIEKIPLAFSSSRWKMCVLRW